MQSLNILLATLFLFCAKLLFCAKSEIIQKENALWAKYINLSHLEMVTNDSIIPPPHFKKLAETRGDLNKDNQEELVIVYDTDKKTDLGTERQLYIYKKLDNKWELWHKSTGPVLPSEHGGMMGDPFEGISIERGCIVIYHFGGSSEKWSYTHRYRFQNDNWRLIGATINFSAPCDHFDNYDYNLATGVVNVKIETEACEGNEDKESIKKTEKFTFEHKAVKPVLMDGFYPGNNEVKIKSRDDSFYY